MLVTDGSSERIRKRRRIALFGVAFGEQERVIRKRTNLAFAQKLKVL
jgi:hypothetical protein